MLKSEIRNYDDYQYTSMKENADSGSLSPFTFLCTILILCLLGLTMLYSASYNEAVERGLPHYHYFFRSLIAGGIGLGIGALMRFVPLRSLKLGYRVLLPLSFVLFVLSFIPPIAKNGAIAIFGSFSISPLSMGFLAVSSLFAGFLADRSNYSLSNTIFTAILFTLFLILTLVVGGLGWAFMLVVLLSFSVKAKGYSWRAVIAAAAAAILLAVLLAFLFPRFFLLPVVSSMMGVYDPELYTDALLAARGAIQHGGITGAGLGNGLYKLGIIPEPQGILIFATVVEELGYVGVFSIVFFLAIVSILCMRTVSRASERKDTQAAVLVIGITLFVVLRSLMNMLYASSLLPFPGIPLPFFSYDPFDEALTVVSSVVLYRLIYIMGRENANT